MKNPFKHWLIPYLPYIIQIIYFNFKYLPFSQAKKLPILLYKPHFWCLRGEVKIDTATISAGMIKLGFKNISQYPDSGIILNIKGTLIFKGTCEVGNNSSIAVGTNAIMTIGNGFVASTSLKVGCQYRIILEEDVRCGWDCTIIDSNFHRLKSNTGKTLGKPYGEVFIGRQSWLAINTIVMKGTRLPERSVVSTRSLLNKDYTEYPACSLFAGIPAKYKYTGVYRDPYDDIIEYV